MILTCALGQPTPPSLAAPTPTYPRAQARPGWGRGKGCGHRNLYGKHAYSALVVGMALYACEMETL
jgi:hypothetical protein